MYSKVRVKRGALNYFRRMARKSYPKEIQVYLLGKIVSMDEIHVTDFVYTNKYFKQTTNTVVWTQEEYNKLKLRAELEGKKIVGDAHSHPDWDAVMSPTDYAGAIIESLWLCGICSIHVNRTRFRFWTPTSALPCKIIYS